MKKHMHILALAAFLVAFAAPAFAQGKILALPRAKFFKANSSGVQQDSTEVAIIVWGGAVTVAAASDTTEWINLSPYNFIPPGFTAQPIVQVQINHQIGAATDSVGYILQYRNDPRSTGFHAGALTHVAANASGSTIIDAMTSSGPQSREFRVILLNNKIASGVTRKYSVVPIIRGWQ